MTATARCRSCTAPIRWASTSNGNSKAAADGIRGEVIDHTQGIPTAQLDANAIADAKTAPCPKCGQHSILASYGGNCLQCTMGWSDEECGRVSRRASSPDRTDREPTQ